MHAPIYIVFQLHDEVITGNYFPPYWPFTMARHRSTMDSPHKRPVMWSFDAFSASLNKRWTNSWVAGDSTAVKLSWIFPGAPLTPNGYPGNIQGNLTGMWFRRHGVHLTSLQWINWWMSLVNVPALYSNFMAKRYPTISGKYVQLLWGRWSQI